MKFCLLYLFCFFLFVDDLSSQSHKYYFSIDDKVCVINVTKLKEYEYFYFEDLQKSKPNYIEGNRSFSYSFGQTTLMFLPGSMFFAIHNKNLGIREFQMNRPAILFKEKLLVPFVSFLDCITNSGIFEKSFSSKSFAFKYKEPSKLEKVPSDLTKKNEKSDEYNTPTQKVEQAAENSAKERLPRLVLTNNERYNLEPTDGKQTSSDGKMLRSKGKRAINDTIQKVPPKYYVLPPELRNSPK